MNTSDTVTLHIEKIVPQGLGLAFHEGTAVFVPYTAPGDRIRAVVTKRRRRHMVARTLTLLEAGPERIDPGCGLFTHCGGCQLRHLSPSFQRQIKQTFVRETIHRFPNLREQATVKPVLAVGESERYRRRASLKVRWVAPHLLLGFFQPASHHVADLTAGCPVLVTPLAALIDPLRTMLATLSVRAQLPQVDAVAGEEGTGLIFHLLATPTPSDLTHIKTFANAHGVDQVWLQTGRKSSLRPLINKRPLFYTLDDQRLTFRPDAFIQAHAQGNRRLVEEVITLSGRGEVAWDLFCGIGNLSLPLAKRFTQLVGVESYEPARQRAQDNARHTPFRSVHFKHANLFTESGVQSLTAEPAADVIVLDPPREGALTLVKWLSTPRPKGWPTLEKILYISCNPATFARDAAILVHGGFQWITIQPLDMFPHTSHVELVTLFVRTP